jgi:hypothetical protein
MMYPLMMSLIDFLQQSHPINILNYHFVYFYDSKEIEYFIYLKPLYINNLHHPLMDNIEYYFPFQN